MRIRLLLLLCLLAFRGDCRIDSVLALPAEYHIKALWVRYAPDWSLDSVAQISVYEQLQEELENRGREDLARQMWLMKVFYKTLALHRYQPDAIAEITGNIEEAWRRGWVFEAAECMIFRGEMYYDQKRYGPAFESFLRGYDELGKGGFELNLFAVRHVAAIAEAYYQFGDYENAARYAREVIARRVPWDNIGFERQLLNTLGLCYQKLMQYDSAIACFDVAFRKSLADNDSSWAALVYGNLGYTHYLKGEYDAAIPKLKFDYDVSRRLNEYSSATNAALVLAEICLLQGNADCAREYIEYAHHVNREDPRALSRYYKSLYTISRLLGDLHSAVAYMDSFLVAQQDMLRESDASILARANMKVEVERHAHEVNTLKARRDREILLRNGALLFLLMISLTSGLWISRRNLKRRKEYEVSELQKQHAEEELASARQQLQTFTRILKEKNTLLESFTRELESLQQDDTRTAHLSRLINATLMTEEDWREFRQLFDIVHPGFLVRLREKLPDLNPAEVRLLALTKLKLAPKEMAAMLGISYEAIKKSRQRLRKKLNMSEEGTLDELTELI